MKKSTLVAFLMALGTSSLASAALAADCATLYEHVNYRGDSRKATTGNTPRIGGIWNDQVSSIKVRSGCVLNAYEHIKYGGAHETFVGNVPRVGAGWNDRISSYTCSCKRGQQSPSCAGPTFVR